MSQEHTTRTRPIPIFKLASGNQFCPQHQVVAYAVVDVRDFDHLNQFQWLEKCDPRKRGYAVRWICKDGGKVRIYMHDEIWERHNGPIPSDLTIDHRSQNTWDNRLANLRLATDTQQQGNKALKCTNQSGYKGVSFDRQHQKYRACIGRPTKNLGRFDTAKEAAIAYNKAAVEYFGEFAYLNPIED